MLGVLEILRRFNYVSEEAVAMPACASVMEDPAVVILIERAMGQPGCADGIWMAKGSTPWALPFPELRAPIVRLDLIRTWYPSRRVLRGHHRALRRVAA